jgi:heptose-I-phosphate ethanolaminephosphotransferase
MSNFSVFKKIFYFFAFSVCIAFLFELLTNVRSINPFFNALENLLFSFIVITPIYFISKRKTQVVYILFAYLVFSIILYIESVYYHLFESYFSSSVIFILLDTNISEASEFLKFYTSKPVVLFSLLMLFVVSLSFFKINKTIFQQNKSSFKSRIIVIFSSITILVFLKFSAVIVFNFPYLLIKSFIEYTIESNKLGDYKLNTKGNFQNVKRTENHEENEVYVIILGESSSRSHMGVYDYYRSTTPMLENIKDNLLIYNDVVSPHAFSIGSISKALTLGNYESPSSISSGSIIQLANTSNFETTWLSNQRPIGIYESLITKISLSSNSQKFLTSTIARNNKVLDENLLPELDKVLFSNEHNKKFIVVHLIGSHLNYKNRYPDTFKVFKDEPLTKFESQESFNKINQYDNAILYTDFIASEIIKKIEALNVKSFVLFLSDHGEEVYKDRNMAGHNEAIPTKDMFDIPFMLWRSDKYKHDKMLSINFDRKYMIDDLFHSLSDLLSISSLEVDSTRSIFNRGFKDRKRIILDSVDYDTFFK